MRYTDVAKNVAPISQKRERTIFFLGATKRLSTLANDENLYLGLISAYKKHLENWKIDFSPLWLLYSVVVYWFLMWPSLFQVFRTYFVVHFCWPPFSPAHRHVWGLVCLYGKLTHISSGLLHVCRKERTFGGSDTHDLVHLRFACLPRHPFFLCCHEDRQTGNHNLIHAFSWRSFSRQNVKRKLFFKGLTWRIWFRFRFLFVFCRCSCFFRCGGAGLPPKWMFLGRNWGILWVGDHVSEAPKCLINKKWWSFSNSVKDGATFEVCPFLSVLPIICSLSWDLFVKLVVQQYFQPDWLILNGGNWREQKIDMPFPDHVGMLNRLENLNPCKQY